MKVTALSLCAEGDLVIDRRIDGALVLQSHDIGEIVGVQVDRIERGVEIAPAARR